MALKLFRISARQDWAWGAPKALSHSKGPCVGREDGFDVLLAWRMVVDCWA